MIKNSGVNLLVKSNFTTNDFLNGLKDLISSVIFDFKNNLISQRKGNIFIRHQGGKQTYAVFECRILDKKIAIKLYKPITTHLIVHSVAREYITHYLSNSPEFKDFTLYFPDTIAIGQIKPDNNFPSISILVQEWIDNTEEIHKIFPKNHVVIIKTIMKVLTSDNGFMVDIMSKNWLASTDNKVNYVDLVLFNPKGKILEKIKFFAQQLE